MASCTLKFSGLYLKCVKIGISETIYVGCRCFQVLYSILGSREATTKKYLSMSFNTKFRKNIELTKCAVKDVIPLFYLLFWNVCRC